MDLIAGLLGPCWDAMTWNFPNEVKLSLISNGPIILVWGSTCMPTASRTNILETAIACELTTTTFTFTEFPTIRLPESE